MAGRGERGAAPAGQSPRKGLGLEGSEGPLVLQSGLPPALIARRGAADPHGWRPRPSRPAGTQGPKARPQEQDDYMDSEDEELEIEREEDEVRGGQRRPAAPCRRHTHPRRRRAQARSRFGFAALPAHTLPAHALPAHALPAQPHCLLSRPLLARCPPAAEGQAGRGRGPARQPPAPAPLHALDRRARCAVPRAQAG